MINLLESFGAVSIELYIQERERIDDVLAMLNEPSQVSTDDGATLRSFDPLFS